MILAAIRYTASLGFDAVEALLFGCNHLSDQAADRVWRDAGRARSRDERLAEVEAEEECSEPSEPQIVEDENIPRGIVGYGYDPSIFQAAREAQAKELVFRPADIKFVFNSWRLDVFGRDRISLTVMADDGTSLQINDANTADLLQGACGQYLQEHEQQLAADEDNAHILNDWLPSATPTFAAPAPNPPGPERAEGPRVAPSPSSPTERDTEPPTCEPWSRY